MAEENTSSLSQEDLDILIGGGDETVGDSSSAGEAGLSELNALAGGESLPDQSGMGLDPDSLDALVGSIDGEKGQPQAAGAAGAGGDYGSLDLSALSGTAAKSADKSENIDFLKDITLRFTVELGRTNMLIKDVLKLGQGSTVALDKDEGDEYDIYVNDRIFGRGKLKVIDEYFGIQITQIIDTLGEYRNVSSK